MSNKALFFIVLLISSCSSSNLIGTYKEMNSEYSSINLLDSNKFNAKILHLDLINIKYYEFNGTWILNGSEVILTSSKTPKNYNLVQVNEFFTDNTHSDSIVIKVTTDWGYYKKELDSVNLINVYLVTKRGYMILPENGILTLAKSEIRNLRFQTFLTTYPMLNLDSSKDNYFEIKLISPEKDDDIFPLLSFFENEKFKVKRRKLIMERNQKVWIKN